MPKKKFRTKLFIAACCLLSWFSWSQDKAFSEDILIGKGNLQLYGNGYHLQEEANAAFLKMVEAAKKDTIAIKVVSSYRNYNHQERIWNRKYKRFTKQGLTPEKAIEKIIEYSTIPGTSRHHWGTDVDIIDGNQPTNGDVLVPEKFHGNGPFCKLKDWMDTYSEEYGFYLVYTDNANRKGFKYEPWHYSYRPLSKPMLKAYKNLNIKALLKSNKLLGSDSFSEGFINSYLRQNVLDINPELK